VRFGVLRAEGAAAAAEEAGVAVFPAEVIACVAFATACAVLRAETNDPALILVPPPDEEAAAVQQSSVSSVVAAVAQADVAQVLAATQAAGAQLSAAASQH